MTRCKKTVALYVDRAIIMYTFSFDVNSNRMEMVHLTCLAAAVLLLYHTMVPRGM